MSSSCWMASSGLCSATSPASGHRLAEGPLFGMSPDSQQNEKNRENGKVAFKNFLPQSGSHHVCSPFMARPNFTVGQWAPSPVPTMGFTKVVMASKPWLLYHLGSYLLASLSAFGTGCNSISLGFASDFTTFLILSETGGEERSSLTVPISFLQHQAFSKRAPLASPGVRLFFPSKFPSPAPAGV